MKRSAGVTASAVAIMVGSLAFLLFAAIIFIAGALKISQPGTPQLVRTGLVITGFVMLGFSVWGIWTAVGLLRLRAWSRTSILVFSGLLVAFCGLAALMTNFAPFPPPRDAAPVPGGIRAGTTIFYGLLALLGAGWLYFFNRAKTKAQFTSLSDGPRLAPSRPLSVTVIGGFLLFSAAMFLVLGVRPMPATFLGLLVTGLPGHLLYIGYGVLAILLGVGLLRMSRSSCMTIALVVEGNTERAFIPSLRQFLEARLPGGMPRLDAFVQDGRIPTENKLRRVVQNLLQGGADAVIALTDVYTGTHDFADANDARAKMRNWVGPESRFFPHAAQHDFEAWLLPYWTEIQKLDTTGRGLPGLLSAWITTSPRVNTSKRSSGTERAVRIT